MDTAHCRKVEADMFEVSAGHKVVHALSQRVHVCA
jgi:hypothetical protein